MKASVKRDMSLCTLEMLTAPGESLPGSLPSRKQGRFRNKTLWQYPGFGEWSWEHTGTAAKLATRKRTRASCSLLEAEAERIPRRRHTHIQIFGTLLLTSFSIENALEGGEARRFAENDP